MRDLWEWTKEGAVKPAASRGTDHLAPRPLPVVLRVRISSCYFSVSSIQDQVVGRVSVQLGALPPQLDQDTSCSPACVKESARRLPACLSVSLQLKVQVKNSDSVRVAAVTNDFENKAIFNTHYNNFFVHSSVLSSEEAPLSLLKPRSMHPPSPACLMQRKWGQRNNSWSYQSDENLKTLRWRQ